MNRNAILFQNDEWIVKKLYNLPYRVLGSLKFKNDKVGIVSGYHSAHGIEWEDGPQEAGWNIHQIDGKVDCFLL